MIRFLLLEGLQDNEPSGWWNDVLGKLQIELGGVGSVHDREPLARVGSAKQR